MLYDDKLANWMKGGGEVDMPRNAKANWGVDGEVAYRSIRWNEETQDWVYFSRTCPVSVYNRIQNNSKVHLIYDKLADMVRETNKIHAIDDKVTTDL